MCTDCSKVCRSDAEKTLHTKFTGHANYVDKVRQRLVQRTLQDCAMDVPAYGIRTCEERDCEMLWQLHRPL